MQDVLTLKEQGYVVLKGSLSENSVADKISAASGGATTFQELKKVFEDEDLALGPSRKNYRVTSETRGMLLSHRSRGVLDSLGSWNWFDSSIITALPGRGKQPAHRDYSAPTKKEGKWKLVVFSPMHNVTANGGVTAVYPATHMGHGKTNLKRIRLDAGDELVFFSTLLHYGAANNSDKPRVLFSQTYEVENITGLPDVFID